MSVATANGQPTSPFNHSSPGSFSLLLESRTSQCVPGSPSLSPASLYGVTSLPNRLAGSRNSSPAGQTVPNAVNVPNRSGDHIASGSVYSGSPLLRQILRSGHKRQREDYSSSPPNAAVPTSPSPIAVSSKRFCPDSSCVPNRLVILERKSATLHRNSQRGSEQLQVVPGNQLTHKFESSISKPPRASCKSETNPSLPTEDGGSSDNSGELKWFDFLLSGDDMIEQREE